MDTGKSIDSVSSSTTGGAATYSVSTGAASRISEAVSLAASRSPAILEISADKAAAILLAWSRFPTRRSVFFWPLERRCFTPEGMSTRTPVPCLCGRELNPANGQAGGIEELFPEERGFASEDVF